MQTLRASMRGVSFVADVIAKAQEGADGEWYVYGPVASSKEDYDGETLEKAGVKNGLVTFFKMGAHVDYDHKYQNTQDLDDIIGKAVRCEEIEGILTLVVKLFKGKPLAQKVWRHLSEGGEAGFSILGKALKRDPKNHKRILDTEIHMVTIAPCPKGFDARISPGQPALMAIAKAISSAPIPDKEDEEMPIPGGEVTAGQPGMPPTGQPGEMPQEGQPGEEEMEAEGQQVSKSEAGYRPGQGMEVCGNCAHFEDGSCLLVKGAIKPEYSCDLYEDMQEEAQEGEGEQGMEGMPPTGAPGAMPPVRKARSATPHAKCRKCGQRTYCLNCHRKGLAPVSKAYTTGEGVVGEGNQGASALRKQYLYASAAKRKRKRKKAETLPAATEKGLSAQLAGKGHKDPDVLAATILKALGRK